MTRPSFSAVRPTRRGFLKAAGSVTTVALTIGFEWLGPSRRAAAVAASPAVFAPNAFLRIGADGSVTVIAKHVEMGQGAYTGIATVLAEELDADWAQVRVESAPANVKLYANSAFGMQGTGGSSARGSGSTGGVGSVAGGATGAAGQGGAGAIGCRSPNRYALH